MQGEMEDKCGIVGFHCKDESKDVASLVYYCLYDWNSDRKVNFNLSLSELKDFRKTVYIEGLFDDNYYLSNYPEQKITDPLYHYLTIGSKEGKNPSKYFDTLYYTKNNRY